MFDDVRRFVISESVKKIESDLRGRVVWESLTIPMKDGDPVEEALYGLLDKKYRYSDAIVRWFRNDRKDGVDDATLKRTYVDGIQTIYDLLKDYDQYVEDLSKQKRLGKVSLSTGNGKIRDVDPVKDFPTMRHLSGVRELVRALGDAVHSRVKFDSSVAKYQITEDDLGNIGILGDSGRVVCWYTRTFESTNKFVFQLWQNAKTMDRGDAYGDKSDQSPYCTHARSHWDSYSHNDPNYMQFWYLEKIPGVAYPFGDLSSEGVAKAFNAMKGRGHDVIIAMNDTYDDFLDDEDENFDTEDELRDDLGPDVIFLAERLFNIKPCVEGWDIKWNDAKGSWMENGVSSGDRKVVPKAFSGMTDDGSPERVVERLTVASDTLTEIPPLPKGCVITKATRFVTINCPALKSLDSLPDRADGSLYGLGADDFGDSGLDIHKCQSLNADDVIDDKRIDVFKQLGQVAGRSRKDVSVSPDGMTAVVRLNPTEMSLPVIPMKLASVITIGDPPLKGTTRRQAEEAVVSVLKDSDNAPAFNDRWSDGERSSKARMFEYAKDVCNDVDRRMKELGVDDAEHDRRTEATYAQFDRALCNIMSNAKRRHYVQRVGDLLHAICPAISVKFNQGVFVTVNARDVVRLNIGRGSMSPGDLLTAVFNRNIDNRQVKANGDSPVFDFTENTFDLTDEDKKKILELSDDFVEMVRADLAKRKRRVK